MGLKYSKPQKHRLNNKGFGKVGVLMGGPSSERGVSLKSGKAVMESLNSLGVKVAPIDINTDQPRENARLLKSSGIDCAFIALHGKFGEDGAIQEILEELGIPYTGSGISASRLAMDKVASRKIFEIYGLKVPRCEVLNKFSYNSNWKLNNRFGFPLVVKPATNGSSIGLSIVESSRVLDKAVELAFSFDENVLIEEYIKGRELTVAILDDHALPVIEILPKRKFFDYEAKYKYGMTEYIVPAVLPSEIGSLAQANALSAHKILGCFGCSRVDIILTESKELYILEVNTIPGLTQTSLLPKAAKEAGIEFQELCLKLIGSAYEKN